MQRFIDETGVENVACGLIRQAKKDFIKGAKLLFGILGKIPTYKELISDQSHATLSNNADVRWMYDSWRFVRDDPYDMFDMGEDSVIEAWKRAAVLDFYRDSYIKGGSILYANHVKKEDIKSNDEVIRKVIADKTLAESFIAARNYVSTLPEGKTTLHEWDLNAFTRSRNVRRGCGRIPINESNYQKMMSEKKRKNISKAKELSSEGFSPKAIAEELGVTVQAVRLYLRS